MSLILEALKKLERERAARRGGRVDVAGEILRPRDGDSQRRSRVLVIGVASAAAVAAIAITLALTGNLGFPERKTPVAPEERKVTPQPAVQTPPIPAAPARQDEKAVPAEQVNGGAAAVAPPAERESHREAALRPGASKSPGPREEDLSPAEPAAGKPPVELKITGIVWEEDKQARRAFVNGIVASEGSVVEGAKVVEIRPNSVRFSKGGRNFEVPMFQ